MILNLIHEFNIVLQKLEIFNLFKQLQLKHFPWVLVGDCILLHLDEDLIESHAHICEYLLVKLGKGAIVGTFNACRPGGIRKKWNLTEILPLTDLFDMNWLIHVILNPHLAISASNKIKALTCGTLLYLHIFRRLKNSFNIILQEFSVFFVTFEDWVLVKWIHQDELGNLLSQWRRQERIKLVQFTLVLKSTVGWDHKLSDDLLKIFRDLHLLHICVCYI